MNLPVSGMAAGSAALGLEGNVLDNQLYNLFDGYSPDGSKALVQLQKHKEAAEHLPGWDLTFSGSQIRIRALVQASSEFRQRIQEAHAAVKAGIDYLQETSAYSRHGR